MSSHWEWEKRIVAQHDLEKPFAPENGSQLQFKIGDPVIFTNINEVRFRLRITGLYRPAEPCSLYATGRRYFVDSSSPWFPVKEAELQLDVDNRNDLQGAVGKHTWAIGIPGEEGYPVFVDDCQLPCQPTQTIAKTAALEIIHRLQTDPAYRLNETPS